MQRVIKFIVISLVVIIFTVGIGAVLLSTFVDPNQFKARITQQVAEKSGYHVALNGNIGWALFPSLGISIENIEVKARADAPPFITLKEATVRVKLLSLLDKPMLDAITIDGLTMQLRVDGRGTGNWQTDSTAVTNKKINTPAPQAEVVNTISSTQRNTRADAMELDIQNIDISNATITYSNEKEKQTIDIKNLNIESKNISSNGEFPVSLAFDIYATQPGINGHLDANTLVVAHAKNNTFSLNKVAVEGAIGGDAFGGKNVPVKLAGDIVIDNQKQKIHSQNIVVGFSNALLNTSLDYNLRNGEYKGNVLIPEFDMSQLQQSIAADVQTTEQKKATLLALNGELIGNKQYAFLNNVQLLLGDVPLTARIGVSSFDSGALDITLNGNQVDVEKLLLALGKEAQLNGLLSFSTHLTTNGSGDVFTQKLGGNGQFDIANALLKGENLTQKLCDAVALIHGESAAPARSTDTHFDVLKGSFAIQNGVVRSNDLTAQIKGADVKSTLITDLTKQTLRADVGITVTGDSDDIACRVNDNYKNVAFPIRCEGTYQTESGKLCNVDKEGLAAIAKGTAINKATQKLEEKYGPGVKGVVDKLFGQ